MVSRQHVFNIKTSKIIFNFSVWIFLNFLLIPSVKVSVNSDRLPESIKNTINTLRFNTLCVKIRYEMNASQFNCLRLNLCQRLGNLKLVTWLFTGIRIGWERYREYSKIIFLVRTLCNLHVQWGQICIPIHHIQGTKEGNFCCLINKK